MPITKSAIKKVRVDKRRASVNRRTKAFLRSALRKARENPSLKSRAAASRMLSLAAKKKVIHKNKASRLLSRLSKRRK